MRFVLPILLLAFPAAAEPPRVVTDIPVIQSLVAAVLGDEGESGALLEYGADAHDFQLRAAQARALQEADLLVWVGPELTPWLARAAGEARTLTLLAAPETRLRRYADGAVDPHAWLDPANAVAWLGLIADELARIDPANAEAYRSRAALAQARIEGAREEIAATLAPAAGRGFVVYHDAYGYFADVFGLTILGSVAAGDAAPPSAARVADLRHLMAAGGAVCIFPDAGEAAGPVEVLAEGTDVRIGAALDGTGSLVRDPGPDGLYDLVLHGLAAAIAECLAAG